MTQRHAWLCCAVLAALTGCSGDDDAEETAPASFAFSEDAGGGLFVAVVGNESSMTGYLCDGTDAGVTVSRWFDGAVEGGAFDLDDGDGARLAGQVSATSAAITIELPGEDPVELTAGGDATLLRGEVTEGDAFLGGWIFVEGGEVRGTVSNVSGGPPPTGIVSPRDPASKTASFVVNGAQVTLPVDSYINAYLR
jgi:hypothetical protein